MSGRQQPNRVHRKQALIGTAMSACTILVGVCVFAYRTDNTFLGDGHIGFGAVLLSGVLVLIPVLSLTAYLTMRRNHWMILPVGIVSVAVAVLTATGQPGNLFLLSWFLIMGAAVPFLALVTLVIGRYTRRRQTA